MYVLLSRLSGRERKKLSKKNTSLSQYVKILCNVIQYKLNTLAKRLKVVIAAGLTSSHLEQRS